MFACGGDVVPMGSWVILVKAMLPSKRSIGKPPRARSRYAATNSSRPVSAGSEVVDLKAFRVEGHRHMASTTTT
jgi:hypothetical protein